MKRLLSTKEVAQLLDVNEKMVYSLVSEKGLPATKVTGKWLFPADLVDKWIENSAVNIPLGRDPLPNYNGLLIIAGSNDILLDRAMSLYNRLYKDHLVVFGNLGSMGGLKALRRSLCHISTSHLIQDKEDEYNFSYVTQELGQMPAVVNFCVREQSLLVARGNAKKISGIQDLARDDITMVNRRQGTGTRLLLDKELSKHGIDHSSVKGYEKEVERHLDVGIEILSGRADCGMAISGVAGLLNLEYIPVRNERYDLVISKEYFFQEGVQLFIGLLHEDSFRLMAEGLLGYELKLSGKMVYPQNITQKTGAEVGVE